MLTKNHSIVHFDRSGIRPDRIMQRGQSQYLDYAAKLVSIYRDGVGRTREALKQKAEAVFRYEPNCPPKRVKSFVKLLEDAADWEERPVERCMLQRRRLFTATSEFHPLLTLQEELYDHLEAPTKQRIADDLGLSLQVAEATLFDDVMENQCLRACETFQDERELLAAYNVGQTQAMLYKALKLEVELGSDFHHVVRHANLCRLMQTMERVGDQRLKFTFDGPATKARKTRRYGAPIAKFLPSLLTCKDWSATAYLGGKGERVHQYRIDHRCGLSSGRADPKEFDSELEARFAAKWGAEPRNGWRLIRDVEPIYFEQTAIIPDFAFRHESGKEIYLEIAGFWTPQYLRTKCQKLEMVKDLPLILAVPERIKWTPPQGVISIRYKGSLSIQAVQAALASMP